MVKAGVFGKVPTHGDFVSCATGSATGRSFERWLQMSNDRLAELGKELPAGPIGFVYRDETGNSVLVGTMLASRDSVGRKFPLALFCEVAAAQGLRFPGLPGALASVISQLAELAETAPEHTHAELTARVRDTPLPTQDRLEAATLTDLGRLEKVALSVVLDRIYGDGDARYFGTEVLLRACENARQHGVRGPVMVDARATSDIELLFWLACAEAGLQGRVGVPTVVWDVSACRAILALGTPDSNVLHIVQGKHVQLQRLWPTRPSSPDSASRARTRLSEQYVRMLEQPGSMSAQEFVAAIASTPADDG